jgi:hypothetical protein
MWKTHLAESPIPAQYLNMTVFRAIGLAMALALLSAQNAAAQIGAGGSTDAFDPSTIRSVISGQISAFLAGDMEQAYSFAAPSIRGRFSSVDQFIGMVKKGYAPVYAPRNYAFGKVLSTDGDVVQQVFVTGPEGKNWIAVYTLQHQPDGSWKISGCYLQPDESKGA